MIEDDASSSTIKNDDNNASRGNASTYSSTSTLSDDDSRKRELPPTSSSQQAKRGRGGQQSLPPFRHLPGSAVASSSSTTSSPSPTIHQLVQGIVDPELHELISSLSKAALNAALVTLGIFPIPELIRLYSVIKDAAETSFYDTSTSVLDFVRDVNDEPDFQGIIKEGHSLSDPFFPANRNWTRDEVVFRRLQMFGCCNVERILNVDFSAREFEVWAPDFLQTRPAGRSAAGFNGSSLESIQAAFPNARSDLSHNFMAFLPLPQQKISLSLAQVDASVAAEVEGIRPILEEFATGQRSFLEPYRESRSWERFPSEEVPRPLISNLPEMTEPGFTNDILFTDIQNFPLSLLLDVSGSGKTRRMYEFLCHRFGFYLVGSPRGNGGSEDVLRLTEVILAKVKHSDNYPANSLLAKYSLALVIYIRLRVLKAIQVIFPKLTPKQWLLIQAYPCSVLHFDIFESIIQPFLETLPTSDIFLSELKRPSTPLLILLDEAQVLMGPEYFAPLSSKSTGQRTILTPFVDLKSRINSRIILAGTGLQLDRIMQVYSSGCTTGVDKNRPSPINQLGGFQSLTEIKTGFNLFGFHELANSPEAVQYLFDTVRGRHRFLISVLYEMIVSPSLDYRAAVQKVVSIHSEADIEKTLAYQIKKLFAHNVTQLDQQLGIALSQMVHSFSYYSLPDQMSDVHELLERALCRFSKSGNRNIVEMNEPLVALVYRRVVETSVTNTYAWKMLCNQRTSSSTGNWFEFAILRPLLLHLSGSYYGDSSGSNASIQHADSFKLSQLLPSQLQQSESYPDFLKHTCSIEHYDPRNEPACFSRVNSIDYDIPQFLEDPHHPSALFAHTRSGPDVVMIMRFRSEEGTTCRVSIFIQLKAQKKGNRIAKG